jgi:hypothetical protein
MVNPIDNDPIAPTEEELPALAALDRLVRSAEAGGLSLVDATGERVALPESAVRLLRRALDALKRDQVVTVDRMLKDMTVAQAADLLDLPRRDFVRLAEERGMSIEEHLGRRRVRFEDVMVLKRERDEERGRILTELAQDSQEIMRLIEERTAAGSRAPRRRAG